MCTVQLPPGGNPIAVNKYINITLLVDAYDLNFCHQGAVSVSTACLALFLWVQSRDTRAYHLPQSAAEMHHLHTVRLQISSNIDMSCSLCVPVSNMGPTENTPWHIQDPMHSAETQFNSTEREWYICFC
jgi:hypothetical protein